MSDPEIARLREIIAARPRATEIAQMRIDIDQRGRAFGLAPDVSVQKVDAGGVPAEWTATPDADSAGAILYFHGGGYVIGSLDSHRHLAGEVGRASGTRTLAIDYRLAPEHPFPAPVQDAVISYRYLLDSGIAAKRIVLAGDSAGGGLVVGAMLAIREAGLALPAGGWCISPWVDMEAKGASFIDRAETDPTVQKATIEMMAQWYLGGANPRHPHAAPLYGDLRGLPPLLIQVGAVETLLDDSIALARKAAISDVMVNLQVWPEMIHVWPLFFPMLTAGRCAIADGGSFVRNLTRGH
ncbi:alpha/beta hydrolase [Rhodopila globiformis]|uniref:Alpha/beta hydrolase n=1 Tax=Rhodopila globiformis TaxID=1071 RepID=A0A2S6N679_RHOGL|nr:alpha/beta hydrolase [Rhodopila globiformis]PPQ30126.1 alpha/beta hydrolase [Rhodopila globiformis]